MQHIALYAQILAGHRLVPIERVVLEYRKDDALHSVRQRHDQFLVSPADAQDGKLVFERTATPASGLGTQALPLRVLPLLRLPALSWLLGQIPIQDASRSALLKLAMSALIPSSSMAAPMRLSRGWSAAAPVVCLDAANFFERWEKCQ